MRVITYRTNTNEANLCCIFLYDTKRYIVLYLNPFFSCSFSFSFMASSSVRLLACLLASWIRLIIFLQKKFFKKKHTPLTSHLKGILIYFYTIGRLKSPKCQVYIFMKNKKKKKKLIRKAFNQ